MATVDKYLWFDINLTDKALVTTLQAAHPAGIFIAPNTAAHTYAVGGVDLGVQLTTDPVVNPGIRSAYFIPNSDFPRDVQEFNKKSGGWFGLSFLFGNNTRYHWVGFFKFAGDSTAKINGVPTEIVAIAQRRYIIGFEQFSDMEMGSIGGTDQRNVTRAASRHVDGMGWENFEIGAELTANSTQLGGAAATKGWDRFYVQLVAAPSATSRFFRVQLSGGASRGASLNWTVDRRIVCHNISDAGAETAIATTTMQFTLGQWYRLDVLHEAVNPGGRLRLWVAKELVLTANMPAGTGLGAGSNWSSSKIGMGAGSGGGTQQQITRFDDWIGADWPTPDSGGRFTGLDWLNGSRVVRAPVTGFGVGNAWLGDPRFLNHYNTTTAEATAKATSIVSGDALRVTVDTPRIKAVPGSLGAVAFTVGYYGQQLVGGQGTLGWKFDGLIDLAAQTGESTAAHGDRRMYRPAGLLAPIANFTPFELHKIKAANVDMANCWALGASIELIGIFGQEDVPADEVNQPEGITPKRGVHNAPYPETPWARSSLAQSSPVVIHTGTYVGNGTVTELLFRAPVHWMVVTRTSSAQTGNFWFSPMYSAHEEGVRQDNASDIVEARIDPTLILAGVVDQQEQRTRITIVGNSAQFNAVGITYQYIAFEDPGSRFCINGGFGADPTAWAAGFPVSLGHSTFLPQYLFTHGNITGAINGTYDRYIKGVGHAAPNASILNAAETVNGLTVAAGLITAGTSQMLANINRVFSAWRQDDQSADAHKLDVVRIGSYVGDGAASRTINFATSGKRPVYAIITPHNATSIHRSPFNLLLSSNVMSNGASTNTGITAGGIDSFTVGVTLNANAITYEYFVLIGSATAGNGGWSIDGEFSVVEPDSPADGDYDDPIEIDDPDPDPVDPDPDPGPADTEDCLAGDVCIAATTRVVNVALTHIGVTKLLTNYCTQTSTEAQVARALYEDSVRKVLRDFPWPFATKYAALALTAIQPAAGNDDWTYSYRQPVDCIFERRLVTDREGTANPTPPPFMLSSDASGGLIFTNEPNAFLCYTARPVCVAFASDVLYREALAWHLAGALAPPLTRMTDVAKMCHERYQEAIAKAHDVIKPGVPGLRIAADPAGPDAGAACIAANVDVANSALLRIGARPVSNLSTEQSREAIAVMMIFESELRATLRDYPWRFAKRYNDAPVFIAGTETVPVNADWQYSHRLPADYVMARRLITEGTGRSYDENPKVFEIGTDTAGPILFSHELEPLLEYTARIPCAVNQADPLFKDAFAWRLAAALAPTLAQVDPEMPEQHGRGPEDPPQKDMRIRSKPNKAAMRLQVSTLARQMYNRVLIQARVADANEANPEHPGEAPWIAGR